jgi:predicted DCC family thiol-disulfide oxidoreductase YuxK
VTATLVYDGDCAFCTSSVQWMTRRHLAADEVIAWQHADLEQYGLTAEQCDAAAQLVLPEGVWSGHRAFGKLLLRSQWWWKPLGALILTPPTSWLAGAVYRFIAANRDKMPGGTPACALPAAERPVASNPKAS